MAKFGCRFNFGVRICLGIVVLFLLVSHGLLPVSAEGWEYAGVATVKIDYWYYDGYGNLAYLETNTYQKNVNIYVRSPATCESFAETNPFNLMITTEGDLYNPLDGEFLLYSGDSFINPTLFEGCVLLQYWTFTINGNYIYGTLTNTHEAEGMVLNSLWAGKEIYPGFNLVWPYIIEAGSTIQGTIDEYEAHITIQGNSKCLTRPFLAEIAATRVK